MQVASDIRETRVDKLKCHMTLDKHVLEHGGGVGEKLVDSIESLFLTRMH